MNRLIILFFILLQAIVKAQTPAAVTCEADSLFKLEGKWEGTLEGGQFTETWKRSGNYIEGKGILVRKGEVKQHEKLKIDNIHGHWVYLASVGGARPVLFTLAKSTNNNQWLFENKEHDFPQQIDYLMKDENTLYVKVSGLIKGKLQQYDYYLRRVE